MKQELKSTKQKIENRESQNNKMIISDLTKLIKMGQSKRLDKDDEEKLNKHKAVIQSKERQIRKMQMLEKMFITRLKTTKMVEGEAQEEIKHLDDIRKQIKAVGNIDELKRLMESLKPPPPPPKKEKPSVFRTTRVSNKPRSIQLRKIDPPATVESSPT